MEGIAIADFGWILLFAALAGMISVKLRLPSVAGLLVAGMLMGPNVLHLVSLPTIETFADIGAVLLLFMIGVEFSVSKILSTGLRAVISSLLLILFTFTLMHELAILLGFDPITSLFIGAMFSMSSTAIMMKLLEQKGVVGRQEVPVLVTILIIEDIVAVFMLTFFSSLREGGYGGEGLLGAVIISLGILAFGYLILLRLLQKFSQIFLRYQAEDTLILFSFTLGIGMSVAASMLGLTPAIGAFLAGSIIAGLPNGRDFEHAIRPFSHVFSSFFFLSVGMMIEPATLLVSADTTIVLIGSFMVIIMLASTFTFYLISTSGRSSLFAGLALLPLGEFSLLIAQESVGLTQMNLVGVASIGVLVTSLACSLTLGHSEPLYLWFKSHLPKRALSTLKDASGYFLNVVSAFEKGGYFHKLLVRELQSGASDILYVLGASMFFLIARGYLQFEVSLAGQTFIASTGLLAVIFIISLVPLSKLAGSFRRIFDALAMIFSHTTPVSAKGSILRNVLIGTALFMLFANSYLIIDFLLLPRIFNWLSVISGLLSVFFFWSAVRASSLWLFLSKRTPANILSQKIVTSDDDLIFVAEPPRQNPAEGSPQVKKAREKASKDRDGRNHGFGRL